VPFQTTSICNERPTENVYKDSVVVAIDRYLFNAYRSGAQHGTILFIAPSNVSVPNDVFAWFIVPWIAVGRF
jgi:hypothetical protein